MSSVMHDMTRVERAVGLAVIVAAGVALAGCQAMGSLSTAASMLVEVDVYKGPLGSGKTVQLGELAAIADQADYKLELFMRDAQKAGGCINDVAPDRRLGAEETADRQHLCDAGVRARDIRQKLKGFPAAPKENSDTRREQLLNLSRAAKDILDYQALAAGTSAAPPASAASAASPAASASTLVNGAVIDASRLATQLKVEAFYWSELQISRVATDPTVRSILVGYVNLVSELANQISARAVAIDKQLDLNVAGNALALSDHLKEAGPSDFLHLYDWYQASLDDSLNAWPARLSAPDRVRLAKRLFSDHYWTRINQVHASGQGEVRMALIKDDIGNWNLKSFDNDPENLLAAYRNLTLAGIEAGVRVAREMSSGGGSAALDLASQFTRSRLGSTQASTLSAQRIDAMRADVAARLEKIRADAIEEDATQKASEEEADKALKERQIATSTAQGNVTKAAPAELADAQQKLADAKAQEAAAAEKLDTAKAQRREKMAVAFENARREIDVHRRVIDSLKQFQVTSPSTPTTTRTLSNTLKP
jgi:hypothetical protein